MQCNNCPQDENAQVEPESGRFRKNPAEGDKQSTPQEGASNLSPELGLIVFLSSIFGFLAGYSFSRLF